MTWLEEKIKQRDENNDPGWLKAQLEVLATELAARAEKVRKVLEAAEEETRLHGVDVGADGTTFVYDCDCRLCQDVREWRLNANKRG